MEPIHFFRAGKHVTSGGHEVTFTEADLQAIADRYDRQVHEAPIVVGHPKIDAPAFGWVDKVIAKSDGLHAVVSQVMPEFAELVQKGAYKKVSAAFYPRGARNNPRPDSHYLRHIGFLGAEPPSLKGLSDIKFSELDETEEEVMLFKEQDILAFREHSLMVREREFVTRANRDMIVKIQRAGRFPIGLLPGVLAFAEGLSETETFSFSEGEETITAPRASWFVDFLSKLPVPVSTEEIAKFHEHDTAPFVVPKGYSVDERSAQVDAAAKAHQSRHGGSYSDAVKAVEPLYRR